MHFGFSYVGLIYLLMLTIPNLIWAKNQPKGYDAKNENKILMIFERVGQACTTVTALIFSDTNLKPFSTWSVWLIASFIFMLLYECWWGRNFRSQRSLADFYSSFVGIPIAGATLPILGFLLLGIYEKSILLILSVVVLGIGHIVIHLQHRKELKFFHQS